MPLDPELLARRYRDELRWQLGRPEREDLTLRLWLDMIREDARSVKVHPDRRGKKG